MVLKFCKWWNWPQKDKHTHAYSFYVRHSVKFPVELPDNSSQCKYAYMYKCYEYVHMSRLNRDRDILTAMDRETDWETGKIVSTIANNFVENAKTRKEKRTKTKNVSISKHLPLICMGKQQCYGILHVSFASILLDTLWIYRIGDK